MYNLTFSFSTRLVVIVILSFLIFLLTTMFLGFELGKRFAKAKMTEQMNSVKVTEVADNKRKTLEKRPEGFGDDE